MKRRFLSTLMALVLALSLIPTAALAVEEDVAQVGEETYATLDAALSAGNEITLLRDVSLTGTYTMDLAGKTIYTDGYTIYIDSGASVTVTGNGTVKNSVVATSETDTHELFFVQEGAELTIVNGTFNTKTAQAINIYNGTVEILDGTFTCTASSEQISDTDHSELQYMHDKSMFHVVGEDAQLIFRDGKIDASAGYIPVGNYDAEILYGIYAESGAEVVLGTEGQENGPEIISQYAAIGLNNGTSDPAIDITIYGGTFKAGFGFNHQTNSVLYLSGNSSVDILGGTFSSDKDHTNLISLPYAEEISVSVSGGTFNTTENQTIFYGTQSTEQVVVTGGTFTGKTTEDIEDYFPDGANLAVDDDGKVTAGTGTSIAEVNHVEYTSLQAAIDAAAPGDTVILLANTEENVTVAQDKDIIFDLNGFTLNGGTDPAEGPANDEAALTNYGTIVIQDSSNPSTGQIRRDDHNIGGYYVIDNQGTMTIESGSVYNNTGTMPTGSSLIRNYSADAETKASLTITGGHIQQDGFIAVKNDDNGILNITGGTIVTTGDTATSTASAVQNWHEATIGGNAIINGAVWTSVWSNDLEPAKTTIQDDAHVTGKIIVQKNSSSVTVEPALEIAGGTLDVTWSTVENPSFVDVNGGDFTASVPEQYLNERFKAELYSTAKNPDAPYSYYESVAAATAAAQPGDTVTQLRTADAEIYTVTLKYNDGRADETVKATADTEITLPRPSRSGYDFRYWSNGSSTYNGGASYTVTGNVTLTAQWSAKSQGGSSSSGGSTTYSPTLDVSDGSTIKVSPRTPEAGDKVTITPDPDSGYEVGEVTVTDRSGDAVRVTANRDGTYTFTQPRGRVTIEVTFVRAGESVFFDDVPAAFWAYDEIAWAYDNGYVNGTSATTFSPNSSITRQQVWMILARLSGGNPASMAAAREWAMVNDISDGTNPGNAVTRQQLVALLYRYAQMMGYDNGAREALTDFPDAGTVSGYAQEPMQWSVANGIVAGTSAGTLNPAGTATRAQFAVILYRFWDQVG